MSQRRMTGSAENLVKAGFGDFEFAGGRGHKIGDIAEPQLRIVYIEIAGTTRIAGLLDFKNGQVSGIRQS